MNNECINWAQKNLKVDAETLKRHENTYVVYAGPSKLAVRTSPAQLGDCIYGTSLCHQ